MMNGYGGKEERRKDEIPRRSRTDGKDGKNIKCGINIATPPKIHSHFVVSFFVPAENKN
jgi:hypothetical protein